MRLLLLSDIHGNLTALDAVLDDVRERGGADAVALLGDYIDYGMRSNEVVDRLSNLEIPLACAIWGNHERAIMRQDWTGFSSERGSASAKYTYSRLNEASREWLGHVPAQEGMAEFEFGRLSFLAIHGSLKDPYWKAISASSDVVEDASYEGYDVVVSGHNHIPHHFAAFYPCDRPETRNKKRTLFINPGSVGQPRNHDPRAQYAVFDTEHGVTHMTVPYNIDKEQQLFDGSVDDFYRARLSLGI